MIPVRLPYFDDASSWGHAALGAAAAQFPQYRAWIALAFVVYQMREREDPLSKMGDFAEFVSGYLALEITKGEL